MAGYYGFTLDVRESVRPSVIRFRMIMRKLWFILRGDLLYVFPCVILFLCFSVRLVSRLPRFGKRE